MTLTTAPGGWAFDESFGGPRSDPTAAAGVTHVVGTVATDGTIRVTSQAPGAPRRCPICLARGVMIATPKGPIAVEALRPGDPGLDERPPRTAGLRARRPRRIDAGSARTRDGPPRPRRRPNRARVAGPPSRRRPDRRGPAQRRCLRRLRRQFVRPGAVRLGAHVRPPALGRDRSLSGEWDQPWEHSLPLIGVLGGSAGPLPLSLQLATGRVSPSAATFVVRERNGEGSPCENSWTLRSRRARPNHTTAAPLRPAGLDERRRPLVSRRGARRRDAMKRSIVLLPILSLSPRCCSSGRRPHQDRQGVRPDEGARDPGAAPRRPCGLRTEAIGRRQAPASSRTTRRARTTGAASRTRTTSRSTRTASTSPTPTCRDAVRRRTRRRSRSTR